MTKRLLVAVVFLLVSFIASFSALDTVERKIEEVLTVIEENEDVFVCAEKILVLREDNEKIFALFLKHADADMIDKLHIALSMALKASDEQISRELISEIYAFLQVTLEGERVKSENIF